MPRQSPSSLNIFYRNGHVVVIAAYVLLLSAPSLLAALDPYGMMSSWDAAQASCRDTSAAGIATMLQTSACTTAFKYRLLGAPFFLAGLVFCTKLYRHINGVLLAYFTQGSDA